MNSIRTAVYFLVTLSIVSFSAGMAIPESAGAVSSAPETVTPVGEPAVTTSAAGQPASVSQTAPLTGEAVQTTLPIGTAVGTRQEKLAKLTELQGMKRMISQQEELVRTQFARQLSGILEELKAQRGFADDDPKWMTLLTAARELLLALGDAISVDTAIDKWIELYGGGLTDPEIDRILEFYESQAGRKDVEAASGALPKWTEHMMNTSQRVVESGIDRFMKEVEKAIGENPEEPDKN